MFSFLDKDKIYDEEREALNRKRTDIDFDGGDFLRDKLSYLFGKGGQFSEKALLEGARAKEVADINEKAEPLITQTLDAAGNLSGVDATSLQIQPGETISAYEQRVKGIQKAGLQAQNLQLQNRDANLDFTDVKPTSSAVTASATEQLNKADDAASYEYGGKKYMMMQAEQQRLDRQQERLLADRRLDQNYQLEITRLQSKDRERAQNRKDRMFLQLMAGLQNLGQGFTI